MSDLLLFGEVGWEIKASDVVAYLNDHAGENVTVKLNSGGGDVYEGIAVMNALRAHDGQVTVIVEGLAASAASVIACGGANHIAIRPNAELMIHEAWTWADGNAAALSKKVDDLNRASRNIAEVYATRAGGSVDEWRELMRAETWYTAQEALDAGLVDEIRDARVAESSEPVAASYASRMVAHYKFSGRRAAPDPVSHAPLGREKENDMSLNALARELGWDEGDLKDALIRLKNEAVPISGEVEVSYPADVKIVPTEKIKVEPVIGDAPTEPVDGAEVDPAAVPEIENAEPVGESAAVQLAKQAGLTFTMGDVAEGFTAEVDEGGVVTITAPSGAEVGSTAAFTVLVNDTVVTLNVTVRSLSEETTDEPAADPAAPVEPTAPIAVNEMVSVPRAHFEWLNKAAALTADVQSKVEASEREAEVDKWIREEGRFSASLRSKALADHEKNPEQARQTWGSLPKNTVPRSEVGYGRESADEVDHGAAALRKQPNPFPKPKF